MTIFYYECLKLRELDHENWITTPKISGPMVTKNTKIYFLGFLTIWVSKWSTLMGYNFWLINRPGVAGAVLQKGSWLID